MLVGVDTDMRDTADAMAPASLPSARRRNERHRAPSMSRFIMKAGSSAWLWRFISKAR